MIKNNNKSIVRYVYLTILIIIILSFFQYYPKKAQSKEIITSIDEAIKVENVIDLNQLVPGEWDTIYRVKYNTLSDLEKNYGIMTKKLPGHFNMWSATETMLIFAKGKDVEKYVLFHDQNDYFIDSFDEINEIFTTRNKSKFYLENDHVLKLIESSK